MPSKRDTGCFLGCLCPPPPHFLHQQLPAHSPDTVTSFCRTQKHVFLPFPEEGSQGCRVWAAFTPRLSPFSLSNPGQVSPWVAAAPSTPLPRAASPVEPVGAHSRYSSLWLSLWAHRPGSVLQAPR